MNNSPELLPSTASLQQQATVQSMGEELTWAATKHSISPTAGNSPEHGWRTHLSCYQAQHLSNSRQQSRAWVKNSPELLPSTASPLQQATIQSMGEELTWAATKHSISPTAGNSPCFSLAFFTFSLNTSVTSVSGCNPKGAKHVTDWLTDTPFFLTRVFIQVLYLYS